jgi:Leucine-rich repeat (LRR) protein
MPLQLIDRYHIDDAKHERLWKNAIVVFDTSALLDMYFYSETTKQVVINEIFKKLPGRLWMPYQVNYEYLKNRSTVILKPIDSYSGLEKELKEKITDVYKNYQVGISELKSKTKKDDKHPVLDQQIFKNLDAIQQQNETELKSLADKIKEVIKTRIAEIEQTVDNDIIYDAVNTHFDVGNEFSFSAQMELVDEGKKRYEFKIPPGYEDLTGRNKKEGTQIFGDLFAWKEIINQAKKENKPVILISNDVKPDWCVRNDKNPTYIEHPRHELIKEIWDTANVEFWMYSNPQLLYNAKEYLKSNIPADQIKEVNDVANQRGLATEDALACVFTWPVDETTNSPGEYQLEKSLMYLLGYKNKPLMVDWGDGSPIQTVVSRNAVYHQYPAVGIYTVRIYGDIFWFCAMGIGPTRGTQYPKVSELAFNVGQNLDRLQSFAGKLKAIDLSKTTNLTQLLVGSNELAQLDITLLGKLMLLYCESNQLTELDLSENPFLSKLLCSENQLTTLDLSSNNILEGLNCRGNQLTFIDLNNNNNLVELNCAYNKLDENALNNIFRDLPFVVKGKICIVGNPGADTCDKIIAVTKGWVFEPNPHYVPSLG